MAPEKILMAFIFSLITFSATPLAPAFRHKIFFIVWNVGQGQWSTWVQPHACIHFDMGGEFFPWKKVRLLCADKKNILMISHWDWDHINAIAQASKKLPRLCLGVAPQKKPSSPRKARILPSLCTPQDLHLPRLRWWRPSANVKQSNDSSLVFLLQKILLPGDSTQKQEQDWSQQMPLAQAQILLLGHHGSKTSTGEKLLQKLPNLRLAISSARWAKYHHPHTEVRVRLQKHRIPLMRTEDWGSIWLEY